MSISTLVSRHLLWNTFVSKSFTALRQGCVFLIACVLVINIVYAKDITLTESFAGNMSFELTGAGVRRGNDGCSSPSFPSTAQLSIPATGNIIAAFLYWSGSGSSSSYNNVVMNGSTIYADEFYTVTDEDGLRFYSAKADVSSLISAGSSTIRISNLDYDRDRNGTHCDIATAYGGWAVVAVYEEASEPLRVINIFDGFQVFWGSEITLSPDNFVVAENPAAKGGKHAHITWEGDSGNSDSRNGVNETLRFKGNSLSGSGNPATNQFNSYSNTRNAVTDGADIDVYAIGNYLVEGETSVTTRYSSGQDQVLLSAEVISVPNKPVSDLALQVTGPSSIHRGETLSYSFDVYNRGPLPEPSGATVSFPLNDMDYWSATGDHWNCSAQAQSVVCKYNNAIADNTSASPLSVTLDSRTSTASSFVLEAEVVADNFDHRSTNNKASFTTQITAPIYSLSKTGIDVNGGILRAGDTLRYTITITNNSSSTVSGVEVTDTIPQAITSYSTYSKPGGVSEAQVGNNVTYSNITVSSGSSAQVIIDMHLDNDVAPGTRVSNIAIIRIGSSDYIVAAEPLLISLPPVVEGNKPLYLHQDNTLTRTPPTQQHIISLASGGTQYWQLTPALQTNVTLDTTREIPVRFYATTSRSRRSATHDVTIALFNVRNGTGTMLDRADFSQRVDNRTPTLIEASLFVSEPNGEFLAGDQLVLAVLHNNWVGYDLNLYTKYNSQFAQIDLTSKTVIDVESLSLYDAAYPDGTELSAVKRGQTVFLRANVSDPFGAYDISSAEITIKDPSDTTIVASTAMPVVAESGAYKTYEYSYTAATDASAGDWRTSVIATEGSEGIVTSDRSLIFPVLLFPDLTITRETVVLSDPVNGNSEPKAIPGAVLRMALITRNQGEGVADSNTLVIREALAPETSLFIGDLSNGSPIEFVDGPVTSGLTFAFTDLASSTDDLAFSDNGGSTFDYEPDLANGEYDPAVTHIQFSPKGTINPGSGSSQPEFRFHYHVKVQ